jgi:hypothetical protein
MQNPGTRSGGTIASAAGSPMKNIKENERLGPDIAGCTLLYIPWSRDAML